MACGHVLAYLEQGKQMIRYHVFEDTVRHYSSNCNDHFDSKSKAIDLCTTDYPYLHFIKMIFTNNKYKSTPSPFGRIH